MPGEAALTLDDTSYRRAVRHRLGQAQGLPGRCNKHTRAGVRCNEPLDEHGHHGHRCECGPTRLSRHHNLRDRFARLLNDAGLRVSTEQWVPAWDRKLQNGNWERARLDLRVEGGPRADVLYADVVAPHPVTRLLDGSAPRKPGIA